MNKKLAHLFSVIFVTITLSACGGGGGDSEPQKPQNNPPVSNAGVDFSATEGDTVSLNGEGSDTDGTITGYRWTQKTGPVVDIIDNSAANISFVVPYIKEEITATFTLTVTDNDGSSSTDDISVTFKVEVIETIEEAITKLETLKLLPKLSNGAVESNGIREDINAYIDTINVSAEQKTAVISVAVILQQVMEVDVSDLLAVAQLDTRMMEAAQCLTQAFIDPANAITYVKKLEAYTANTKRLAEQYNNYNAALDGTVTRLSNNVNCQ